MLLVYWASSAALIIYEIKNPTAIRSVARWLMWSHDYEVKVLAQPTPANGEFKHIEWDGWGWAGMDTTVFLVFDPSDSLWTAAKSHQPGKYDGIPCEVVRVRRLQSHWYTAQFYTEEYWGYHNALDCGPQPEQ